VSQLRGNIIANYASQIYVAGIGVLILPLYIKYMGSEAYGLVGFFAMLQAWFNVLDLGLTPTIARETARFRGGALSPLSYRQLYRALSVIFGVISLCGGGGLYLLSSFIATKWLNIVDIEVEEVIIAVQIMGMSVALRWMTGLFRGVITGSEKLVWLSSFNAIIASLRFVGVFASMSIFGFSPLVFFTHQLVIALIECIGLAIKAHYLLPKKQTLEMKIGWSFKPVMLILKFSLTIAFTASVWVFITQTDKLVLSGILSLEEYGYFTLSVLVANGIIIISGPISNAIMPRMARLYAEKKTDELIKVYRQSTQLVSIVGGTIAITFASTADSLLYAWTGDTNLAEHSAPILRLYAIGNLFLCVAAFVYYLQYAKGNLRYHLIGNLILVVIMIPSIIIFAKNFGGEGAGYVWLTLNAIYLLFGVSYIHSKLEPNLHSKWFLNDVIKIIVPASSFPLLLSLLDISLDGRFDSLIYVGSVFIFVLMLCVLFSKFKVRVLSFLEQRINEIFNYLKCVCK